MANINMKAQNFGLELEFTGITRKQAAAAIAKTINGNYEYSRTGEGYDKREVTGADGRKWTIMSDASVTGSCCGDGGEFVTPICRYEDIELVQECVRALRKAGAKVDSSCGLHIHIDGANHNAKSLKNLTFTFKAKQDLIFKAAKAQDRKCNRYCREIDERLIDTIRNNKQLDMDSLADNWYNTYAPGQSRRQHYNDSRYHALNLHSIWYRGTVEFRLFHATLHAGEVKAYINLCLAMSAAAINAKRASADVLDNGNDKYAMRCWLLRLGFIGDEYKTVRHHLLKNLDGNAAWRNDPNTYESYNNRRTA